MTGLRIRPFVETDEPHVVELWQRTGLVRPWNDPHQDIARKLRVQRELFLVALLNQRLIGAAMAGYDGHRGWVHYLAVDPAHQRSGIGTALLAEVEQRLRAMGCPKINLQVRPENAGVVAFYAGLDFQDDASLTLGKRLKHDD